MDNLKPLKSKQYYFYFGQKGIAIFQELFPAWSYVSFVNPLDNRIKGLFTSPLKSKKQIDIQLELINTEFNCCTADILVRLDKVIRKIAIFHKKEYKDWSQQISILVNRQITLNFYKKYPQWQSVITSASAMKTITVLYGLETGEARTLEVAANEMGISKQAVAEIKNRTIELLDNAHGYIKKSTRKTSLPEDRERLANALISFRGNRSKTEMAKYFGVSLGIYWKLEKKDNKYITPKHYKIFREALKNT